MSGRSAKASPKGIGGVFAVGDISRPTLENNIPMETNKERDELIHAITELTTRIAVEYPALYRSLDENPITLPTEAAPEMGVGELRTYLNTLQEMVAHYSTVHDG